MKIHVLKGLLEAGLLLNLAQLGGNGKRGEGSAARARESGAECGTARAQASRSELFLGPWASWDHLGASKGSPGDLLVASWGSLGPPWGPPGALLGTPWGLLEASWAPLEAAWGPPGACDAIWGLGRLLNPRPAGRKYTLLRRILMVPKGKPFSRKRAKV